MTSSQPAPDNQGVPSQGALFRLRVALAGLARDYWKDTPLSFKMPSFSLPSVAKEPSSKKVTAPPPARAARSASSEPVVPDVLPVREPQIWAADRADILECLWGEGQFLPGGKEYLVALSSPLGINEDMSILDLCAGLGGLARYLADEYKVYVTGMEVDAALAARGMVMSIAAGKSKTASIVPYDPVNFTASRKFDCIFARELFYRIIGKEKFFKAIDASIKTGGGQIVFTDYILDPATREKTAITNWLSRETGAAPLSSIEMIKMWKGMGYDLRVAEDQTDEYKDMILTGMKNLVNHMIMNRPDTKTKALIVREVDLWARRVEAFNHGLKYYRFYGIRR